MKEVDFSKLKSRIESILKAEYDYQTQHADTLSEVWANFFSGYDPDKYEVVYNDTLYRFSEELETTDCIGELEIYIQDKEILEQIDRIADEEKESLFNEFCIKDYKSDLGFFCYVTCNGHWALAERKTR